MQHQMLWQPPEFHQIDMDIEISTIKLTLSFCQDDRQDNY